MTTFLKTERWWPEFQHFDVLTQISANKLTKAKDKERGITT